MTILCEQVDVLFSLSEDDFPETLAGYHELIVHTRECGDCRARLDRRGPALFSTAEGPDAAAAAAFEKDWSEHISRARFYYQDLLERDLVSGSWVRAEEPFCSLVAAVTNTFNYAFVTNGIEKEAVLQRHGDVIWLRQIGDASGARIEVTDAAFVARALQYREGAGDPKLIERLVPRILGDLFSDHPPDILDGFVVKQGPEPAQIRLMRER